LSDELDGLLISFDQEKAFDRVEHIFITEVLKAMNLPVNFITWVGILYKNINSIPNTHKNTKLFQHADDCSIISTEISEYDELIKEFKIFGQVSGSKINEQGLFQNVFST
jgi:hypothetical protein